MENEYKILITGLSNTDMIGYLDELHASFKCLNTSNVPSEIISDINVFRPNAFMCFYREADDSLAEFLRTLGTNASYSDLSYIIVSTPAGCAEFKKKAPSFPTLMIKIPISPPDMNLLIKKYLDKKCGEISKKTVSGAETHISADNSALKKLLVVDDDIITLEILKSVLEQDYDVTCAESAAMARRCLETKTFDLILLDYVMPGETGAELFKKLKAAPETKKIPVVFLTSADDGNKVKEILALNPQGYLMKPINTKLLKAAVMCALE